MTLEPRQPTLFIAAGFRGVGKTEETDNEIREYIKDDNKIGRKARRSLILDANNEPKFRKYKTLYFDVNEPDIDKRSETIIKFVNSPVISIRRIAPFRKDGRPMIPPEDFVTVLQTVYHSYRDGLFLAEDTNKYITHTNSEKILGLLISLRHVGIDMIIHLQTLRRLTTEMWDNVEWLRLYKLSDDIDNYKERISNFTVVKIAELIVNRKFRENKYFFVYVSPMNNKIRTNKEDFIIACNEYLTIYDKPVRNLMKTGKTREQAIEYWINDHLYYIN